VRIATEGPEDLRPASVTALATVVGVEAAAGLADVAARSRDRAIRTQAIDALAQRPDGEAALRGLAGKDGGPRLPWRMRRYARRALARVGRGAR
jgi:hypothetical protein